MSRKRQHSSEPMDGHSRSFPQSASGPAGDKRRMAMPLLITLADGRKLEFESATTVKEVAIAAGMSSIQRILGGYLNGQWVHPDHRIEADGDLDLITEASPEALGLLRHGVAFLLAEAVKRQHPGSLSGALRLGDDGFYMDFDTGHPLLAIELERIEAGMRYALARAPPAASRLVSRTEAMAMLSARGERYQCMLAERLKADQTVWLHVRGEAILMSGQPLPELAPEHCAFKLLQVSGAYWDGDSRQPMLTRIHGTVWFHPQDLQCCLDQLQEIEKRDHRKLGKQLDLFHFEEQAPGMVYWHPAGWSLWQVIEQYVRDDFRKSGYQEVLGPQLMDVQLWKRSGHWQHYQQHMFLTESEKRHYAVKPMSCPGHVEIYKAGHHSYRDLPVRYAEFGLCHRNEPSGALHGLLRVRGFTQDDGHVFCTADQIEAEVAAFHRQAMQVYRDFGFEAVSLKLALRPPRRMGDDASWDCAEGALRSALARADIAWDEMPGEGAFYGPKLEYHLSDSMGRNWQLGTLQVDFLMPERLDATYVDAHGQRRHPVMLHRAILGSMERFVGILIEHCAGRLPVWLAPVQVVVLNVGIQQADYAVKVATGLQERGIRCHTDIRHETLALKIREHSLRKVPYLLIAGDREARSASVTLRARPGEPSRTMPWQAFAQLLEHKPFRFNGHPR